VNVQDREVDRILHVLQARLLKDEGLDATKVSESYRFVCWQHFLTWVCFGRRPCPRANQSHANAARIGVAGVKIRQSPAIASEPHRLVCLAKDVRVASLLMAVVHCQLPCHVLKGSTYARERRKAERDGGDD
jgi:hypothetical protein